MGVINVTPDSFYDGGRFLEPDMAVALGVRMARSGADIIDIGGESTRPGALPVTPDEELRRVAPVVSALRAETDALLSIDTRHGRVATWALDQGVDIVNDVSSLTHDERMAALVSESGAGLILMHMQGEPRTMQRSPDYSNVLTDVRDYLQWAIARAETAGVSSESILVDPGIGFGKTSEHNLQIINRLSLLTTLGKPLVIGTSRKTFIGRLLGVPPDERLLGTIATVSCAILRGAHVVRVHDVPEIAQAVRVTDAILNETGDEEGAE